MFHTLDPGNTLATDSGPAAFKAVKHLAPRELRTSGARRPAPAARSLLAGVKEAA